MNRRRWRPFARQLRPPDISTIQRPWGRAACRGALRSCEEQGGAADRLATDTGLVVGTLGAGARDAGFLRVRRVRVALTAWENPDP